MARRTLDALRGAGGEPLTAVEVAARVVVAEGLDPDDVPSRIPARRGVWAITCAASRAGGAVERVADGTGVRWRVPVAE